MTTDLAQYIAQSRKVIIMSPHFVNSQKIADCIIKGLNHENLNIGKVDSSIVHDVHNLSKFDIIIYENSFNALNQLSINDKTNKIVIVRWGTENDELSNLLKWATIPRKCGVSILKIGFMPEIRKVNFRSVSAIMSTDMNHFYQFISKSSASLEIKNKVGNHFYSGLSIDGNIILLKKDHLIPHFNEKLKYDFENEFNKSNREDHKSNEYPQITTHKELFGDKFDKDNEIMGKISELIAPNSNQKDFIKNSPKLALLLEEFKENPGKYVIFTNYTKSYGVELIKKAVSLYLKAEPLFLTLNTINEENNIIDNFNKSKIHFLITSIIPTKTLIDVDVLVIFDIFSPEIVYAMTNSCCVLGCGNKKNMPLHVILLHVTSPNEEENTLEEKSVYETLKVMENWEKTYKSYEENSKSIITKGDSFVVV